MAMHCEKKQVRYLAVNNVTSAAISWNKLLQALNEAFEGMDIKIYMYK